LTKIKKLSKSQKEVLLLKAQTEFGDYALYEVRNGTHGLTLYVYPDLVEDAPRLRKAVPLHWNNLFTIVSYIDTLAMVTVLFEKLMILRFTSLPLL
jgi:hypothetical protein